MGELMTVLPSTFGPYEERYTFYLVVGERSVLIHSKV